MNEWHWSDDLNSFNTCHYTDSVKFMCVFVLWERNTWEGIWESKHMALHSNPNTLYLCNFKQIILHTEIAKSYTMWWWLQILYAKFIDTMQSYTLGIVINIVSC